MFGEKYLKKKIIFLNSYDENKGYFLKNLNILNITLNIFLKMLLFRWVVASGVEWKISFYLYKMMICVTNF